VGNDAALQKGGEQNCIADYKNGTYSIFFLAGKNEKKFLIGGRRGRAASWVEGAINRIFGGPDRTA